MLEIFENRCSEMASGGLVCMQVLFLLFVSINGNFVLLYQSFNVIANFIFMIQKILEVNIYVVLYRNHLD